MVLTFRLIFLSPGFSLRRMPYLVVQKMSGEKSGVGIWDKIHVIKSFSTTVLSIAVRGFFCLLREL